MQTHVLIAGTFDGLHAGHRFLLTRAFEAGERVIIGLTSDYFVTRFKFQILNPNVQTNPKSQIQKTIQSYRERKRNIELWLRERGYFERATIIPIDDPYEPAASMKDLDALIVTKENRMTGERINALRQGSTLPPLSLIEVPIVPAEDGKPISSTRLRTGEIDGNGRLIMPESMRDALSKPLGRVLMGTEVDRLLRSLPAKQGETFIVTVGDITTKTFLDAGIIPKLAIIDGMVGRKPFHETLKMLQPQRVSPFEAKGVKSGPGFISREAVEIIRKIFSSHVSSLMSPVVLLVEGEEDLLVLPVIMHAELGSILYYGQPREGLVEVVVTSKVKRIGAKLLRAFTELHSTVERGRPEDDR